MHTADLSGRTQDVDLKVLRHRSGKNEVDPGLPYGFFAERERRPDGSIEDVLTILLTNRECPFRCVMCDLWRNTMDQRVRPGDIPNQIRHALERLPGGSTVKLYNSGNFFDSGAIPPSDLPEIARLLHPFRRVVVENHPKLCDDRCRDFANLLSGQFEIAMGLESVNPAVVRSLNKRMSLQEFEQAAHFLRSHEIDLRTFILLNPPYQDPAQDCHWAIESVRFAVQCGVTTCAIIPVRPGNGMIEILQGEGLFYPTTLTRLEGALATILRQLPARPEAQVLADTWDLETVSNCDRCRNRRIENIHSMNRTQSALPAYECTCTDGEAIVA